MLILSIVLMLMKVLALVGVMVVGLCCHCLLSVALSTCIVVYLSVCRIFLGVDINNVVVVGYDISFLKWRVPRIVSSRLEPACVQECVLGVVWVDYSKRDFSFF